MTENRAQIIGRFTPPDGEDLRLALEIKETDGRITIQDAILDLKTQTGEYIPLLNAVANGQLKAYAPGSCKALVGNIENVDVDEEIYLDDLDDWLKKEFPRVKYRVSFASPATPPPKVTESASDAVEHAKAAPRNNRLTTKEIAAVFEGVNGWNATRWRKNLSASQWLHRARIASGAAGGASATWDPLKLAQLMHGKTKGHKAKEQIVKAFQSRFNRNPVLLPWRDDFNEYFATHCTTD